MMSPIYRTMGLMGLWTAALGAAIGCAPTEPTQIVAGMVTQMRVPEEIRHVGLVVASGGTQIVCENYPVDNETSSVTLPSTFAALSRGDFAKPLTVMVLGFPQYDEKFDTACIIEKQVNDSSVGPQIMRRRSSTFVENEVLFLPMPLRHACNGVRCDNPKETCVAGKCQPKISVDPSTLARFNEAQVLGRDSTCFNAEACVPSADAIIAKLEDPDVCEFSVELSQDRLAALPANAGLNVTIVYDNSTTEILDLDADEGFFLPSTGDGLTRFRLAQGLCTTQIKTNKIKRVVANLGCPSKPPTQAICEDQLKRIISGANQSRPLGEKTIQLKPVKTGLFVAIDHEELAKMLHKWSTNKLKNRPDETPWAKLFSDLGSNPLLTESLIRFGKPLPLNPDQQNNTGCTSTDDWPLLSEPDNIANQINSCFGESLEDTDSDKKETLHLDHFSQHVFRDQAFRAGTFVLVTERENPDTNDSDDTKLLVGKSDPNSNEKFLETLQAWQQDNSHVTVDIVVVRGSDDESGWPKEGNNNITITHLNDNDIANGITPLLSILTQNACQFDSNDSTFAAGFKDSSNSVFSNAVLSFPSDHMGARHYLHRCEKDAMNSEGCWDIHVVSFEPADKNQKPVKEPVVRLNVPACKKLLENAPYLATGWEEPHALDVRLSVQKP